MDGNSEDKQAITLLDLKKKSRGSNGGGAVSVLPAGVHATPADTTSRVSSATRTGANNNMPINTWSCVNSIPINGPRLTGRLK